MDFAYLLTPFITWFIAGCLKFLISCIKAKQLAFGLIGYGGLPSNHSAIVSSMATLIAIKEVELVNLPVKSNGAKTKPFLTHCLTRMSLINSLVSAPEDLLEVLACMRVKISNCHCYWPFSHYSVNA